MGLRLLLIVAAMALMCPVSSTGAPPVAVPEGARFPVQRLVETSPSLAPSSAASPPTELPLGSHFPASTVIGLPVLEMPKEPQEALAKEGEEVMRWVLGSDVLFDFDKAEIRADGERELRFFLDEVEKFSAFRLTVEGHTDSKGTEAYNQDLARRRAHAVSTWLLRTAPTLPVPLEMAFGESRPAVPNEKADGSDDPAGRQLNRRVEIVVRGPTGMNLGSASPFSPELSAG